MTTQAKNKTSANSLMRGMEAAERGVKDRIKSAENISIAKGGVAEAKKTEPKQTPPKKKAPKKKEPVVRSTFSFPKDDLERIDKLITRFARQGVVLNKSEILRVGLNALFEVKDKRLEEISFVVKLGRDGGPYIEKVTGETAWYDMHKVLEHARKELASGDFEEEQFLCPECENYLESVPWQTAIKDFLDGIAKTLNEYGTSILKAGEIRFVYDGQNGKWDWRRGIVEPSVCPQCGRVRPCRHDGEP